jgi:hypothetical protein
VRIVLDRDEDMQITGQRHAYYAKYKVPYLADMCKLMLDALSSLTIILVQSEAQARATRVERAFELQARCEVKTSCIMYPSMQTCGAGGVQQGWRNPGPGFGHLQQCRLQPGAVLATMYRF